MVRISVGIDTLTTLRRILNKALADKAQEAFAPLGGKVVHAPNKADRTAFLIFCRKIKSAIKKRAVILQHRNTCSISARMCYNV